MSNIFCKNKTASSVTVNEYTVYDVNSTNSEIVEVKKIVPSQSGSDTSSGTVFNTLTLPKTHSGNYTEVLFDSLRYYAKGTISDTGSIGNIYNFGGQYYYGTITWEDSSLGDLSDMILTSPPDRFSTRVQQTFLELFL